MATEVAIFLLVICTVRAVFNAVLSDGTGFERGDHPPCVTYQRTCCTPANIKRVWPHQRLPANKLATR